MTRRTVFVSADYGDAWGEWLKASLNARNIDVYSFSKSRTAAPRVIEILDERTGNRLSKRIAVPPKRVENMVDDSGAGDWLTAVFLHYFLERYPVYSGGLDKEALLEMLNAAKEIAALKCSFIGAQGIFQDQDGLETLNRRLSADVTPVSDGTLDWGEGCPCCGRRPID